MNLLGKAAVAAAALTLTVSPAWAGGNGNTTGGTTKQPHGHAYGYYCKNQSKQHVDGQKGTPFSACVKAMAKLDKGTTKSPAAACKGLSKKHVKGTPGTPYSACVKAGAQLLKDNAPTDTSSGGTTTPTT